MNATKHLPITDDLIDRALAALRDAVERNQLNPNNGRLQAPFDYLARAMPKPGGVEQSRAGLAFESVSASRQKCNTSMIEIQGQRNLTPIAN